MGTLQGGGDPEGGGEVLGEGVSEGKDPMGEAGTLLAT